MEVCTRTRNLNDVLSTCLAHNAKEVLVCIEIDNGWVPFDLTIVHNNCQTHDQWGPNPPISMHEMVQAMWVLAHSRYHDGHALQEATRAGFGTWIGLIVGAVVKLALVGTMIGIGVASFVAR